MRFSLIKPEKNDRVYFLTFDPPLRAGEYVKYGFSIWSQHYYAMTEAEAVERYGDRWIREGFGIIDPTEKLEFEIRFPHSYTYQKAVFEENPNLRIGGPNVPGILRSTFPLGQKILTKTLDRPSPGNYFISWIPPETLPNPPIA